MTMNSGESRLKKQSKPLKTVNDGGRSKTSVLGCSKFMFWADQNHLLPLPKVAEEDIPLVYQANNVCIIFKIRNRMKRSINNKTLNKGGRPTKKLSEKRKYRITVKMATEEYYAMKLKAKNAGVSASEIVRMAIRDCHIRARLTTEQADYIRKLCGMANNLNQLTRKAHREGVRLHYGQCQHLLLSLENIIDHISL